MRYDGSVVEVDLTPLGELDTGQLVFQLLSTDSDPGTEFTIQPLSNEVDAEAEARPTMARDNRLVPDGDRVTFSLRSDAPLPFGSLDATGRLRFDPSSDEVGRYTFELIASDTVAQAVQPVTLQVVSDPVTTTRVSGRVLDVDGTPLAGMQVELGSITGLTQSDGSFTLDVGSGPLVSDMLKIRGDTFPGAAVYPFIAEKLPLVLEREVYSGVNNVISRPIYLPPLDVANGTTIDPAQDATVTTPAIPGTKLFVGAGTLMNQQGTPFTGTLSITEVPRELTPAALPANLLPDTVVTIQPGEMAFTQPAPLTLPNRAGFAPGTVMDLWSINLTTGQFDDVGDAVVSADGTVVETTSGGVRNSSWHFVAPPPVVQRNPEREVETQEQGCPICPGGGEAQGRFQSTVELHSGALNEGHSLASYRSFGAERRFALHYDSQRADPRPIIHFGADNLQASADQRLVARLSFQRGSFTQQVPGFQGRGLLPDGAHFWSIPEEGGNIQLALQGDLRGQPSGVYEYTLSRGLLRMNGEEFVGTTTLSTGRIVHINASDSPFGAGWQLGGVQRLVLISRCRGTAAQGPFAGCGKWNDYCQDPNCNHD